MDDGTSSTLSEHMEIEPVHWCGKAKVFSGKFLRSAFALWLVHRENFLTLSQTVTMGTRESIGVSMDGRNILPSANEIEAAKSELLAMSSGGMHGGAVDISHAGGGNFQRAKCRADERIENFCRKYLGDVDAPRAILPDRDFICSKHGIARILSLPENGDEFHSEYVDSYGTFNGILHNPSTDKRTTKDAFHIAAGGLPIPPDKMEVPKSAFAKMLKIAFSPDEEMLTLPFTSAEKYPAKVFVSNYMKPVVCPKINGIHQERRMEIRFFVPGSLISILDCTESIFGNAGSPFLPENDAALDPLAWTGHTGCIVFAPQLRKCTKKSLGLPNFTHATERQRAEGMCWKSDGELYHDGRPFRIMARDGGGVIVSIVADSYSGYGKKEIKSQMSYAANMLGMCEEEHSGGALVFLRRDLGDEFNHARDLGGEHNFENTINCCAESMELKDGFAIDKNFANIVYLPEYANFRLPELTISWRENGNEKKLPIEIEKTYVLPSGYRVNLEKPDGRGGRWKMVGTAASGIFCYKPATVSGGGKSEIAKPIGEFILSGPTIVHSFGKDREMAKQILAKDFSMRFRDSSKCDDRKLLDVSRSLGSVIKLMTPNEAYLDAYNGWLKTIPQHVLELIFAIKRFSRDFGGDDWQRLFSVDQINGECGNELRYRNEKLFEHYLRIGFDSSGRWRLFSLRDDFIPSVKFQLADDITAAALVPAENIPHLPPNCQNKSAKVVHNCEYRLYQRPDEAVSPGYDPGSERDMAGENIFTCNFKALSRDYVRHMMRNRIKFETYSAPMKRMLESFVDGENSPRYAVCPSELRTMDDGKMSKNQRYLQNRSDICNEFDTHLATISMKLHKKFRGNFSAVDSPVDAILSGRRNNPPEDGVKPLCVYGPLHYMDIPELFLEYMASVTGKSPSTTGAGLEGAMTKGPFNGISAVYDLSNALLSFILSGYAGFLSSAGYVGPYCKVDHDITYLLPEIWCRMSAQERDPKFLLEHKYLERCENFYCGERLVQAERLGYRITRKFVRVFAARVFAFPDTIFTDEMLRPEMQDVEIFSESMDTIVDAHRRAAAMIVETGDLGGAIPPLRALLDIALHGNYSGMSLRDGKFRAMFARDSVIGSDWYGARLEAYRSSQVEHLSRGLDYVRNFRATVADPSACGIDVAKRESDILRELEEMASQNYTHRLIGTIGK
ncbi:MAG: hypothetical protein LBT64_03510 [Puniceicoccales bacterium]|nr:hypothetical protein [Puniceicoccales bacterium]